MPKNYDHVIGLRMPQELWEMMLKLGAEEEKTVSQLIREFIKNGLSNPSVIDNYVGNGQFLETHGFQRTVRISRNSWTGLTEMARRKNILPTTLITYFIKYELKKTPVS